LIALLDTHTLIWWMCEPERLGKHALSIIESGENEILVSAASAMEITTKFRLGKLPQAERLASRFAAEIAFEGFDELSITIAHAELAGQLPFEHKDPFDRLLIAQSRLGDLPLLSNEKLFDGFGVKRIW
jgi:PIN domain nuclease of toxin-antitoxin system